MNRDECLKKILENKDKLPKEILEIYKSRKGNIDYFQETKKSFERDKKFIKKISDELIKLVNKPHYALGASRSNTFGSNIFSIGFHSKDMTKFSPFNIAVSLDVPYYYIEQVREEKVEGEILEIINKIIPFLKEKLYKTLPLELWKIPTDIVGSYSMPYEDHVKVHMDMCEEFETFTQERKKEYREGILEAYDGPYTIYNVIFGEHW
ncbi:hypothetical protein A9Q91_02100 [Candidatus Gracilibacteria bacterium 28_42_T64]|nr:hypothetical protein A9Q91_02100 [Candidatus Gracilibacteria bacterium 28_42_T64]